MFFTVFSDMNLPVLAIAVWIQTVICPVLLIFFLTWDMVYILLVVGLLGLFLYNNYQAGVKETTWQDFERNMLKQHDVAKLDIINKETAEVVSTPTIKGTYLITPEHLRGEKPIEFFGQPESEIPDHQMSH